MVRKFLQQRNNNKNTNNHSLLKLISFQATLVRDYAANSNADERKYEQSLPCYVLKKRTEQIQGEHDTHVNRKKLATSLYPPATSAQHADNAIFWNHTLHEYLPHAWK